MCRLSAYFGAPICAADLVTRPNHSVIKQSFCARERIGGDGATPGYLNGDGFGLGWYSLHPEDCVPCVYRQARPAWNDPNLAPIAEKIFSSVLFAHVRAASVGLDVSEGTCHPFRYARFLFMHNGAVGDFHVLRRRILPTLGNLAFDFAVNNGSSDTALCFAIFLNHFEDPNARQSANSIRTAVETVVSTIARATEEQKIPQASVLNFVVTDGISLVASRCTVDPNNPQPKAASLYYASGNKFAYGGEEAGKYAMMHTNRFPTTVIVSSEPLTDNREDWVPVPTNHCLVVTKSMNILLVPMRTNPNHAAEDDCFARVLNHLIAAKIPDPCAHHKGGDDVSVDAARGNGTAYASPVDQHLVTTTQGTNHHDGSSISSSISFSSGVVLCSAVMGPLLCSGTDDGSIIVWDMEQKVVQNSIRIGGCAILSVVAQHDMRILIVGTSVSTIVIYRLTDGNELVCALEVVCEEMGDVLSLAIHDKKLFAGFSDAGLRCVVKDLEATLYSALTIESTVCSNGRNGDSIVTKKVYEVGEGIVVGRRQEIGHMGFVYALTLCPKGRYLCSGCGDGILRVWDVDTWECIQTRDDHGGAILALASVEYPGGTMLFTGSRDCSVKAWKWDGEKGFVCKGTLRKHSAEVMFLAVTGDMLVSGSVDGTVCVYCTISLRFIYKYNVGGFLTAGAACSKYDSLFTASFVGKINIRDVVSMKSEALRKSITCNGADESVDKTTSSKVNGNGSVSKAVNGHSETNGKVHGNDEVDMKESLLALGKILTEPDLESEESDSLLNGISNEEMYVSPMVSPDGDDGIPSPGNDSGNEEEECSLSVIPSNSKACENGKGNGISPHVIERQWMLGALRQFVSFRTVSNSSDNRKQCWEGARFIGRLLERMGASVKYVNTSKCSGSDEIGDDIPNKMSSKEAQALAENATLNPIVLARFASSKPNASTITLYGHYDVMPAVDKSMWDSDPWAMEARDGYLYGRGTTDNKGPIIAMVFAVKRLMEKSMNGLDVNVVLVLQGEGEASNEGFKECIKAHLHWFERTCLILTSNSIWLGEKRPCLTYGFRGNVDLLVSISGGTRNLHSGVDGGAVLEPMNDLIAIIGTLVDASGVVRIDGFYDDVRPMSQEDRQRLSEVDFDVGDYGRCTGVKQFTTEKKGEILESRWRLPSVSVASVETTNTSGFYSVVPRRASAKVSIRFVPDQKPEQIEQAVREHLQSEIRKRQSCNELKVECVNQGDWWLGDPTGVEFQIAGRAVREVWGVEPQLVCEGGSMPLFTFLAKTLDAPLVQVPLGQASDGAHLPNERIRELNLYRGKDVMQKIVAEVAERAVDGRIVSSE